METSCPRISRSSRHTFVDLRKNVLKTKTRFVGFGGDERVVCSSSANSKPDLAYVSMMPETEKAHDEQPSLAPALGSISLDGSLERPVRKLSEELRAKVCGMLIEAQEKERAWIARELHDDISQRVALMAIQLGQWDQNAPPSMDETHRLVSQISLRLSEVLQGIRTISHHLHSSNLDYIGLESAVSSFCTEFSEMHNVTVDLSQQDIPHDVPKEVSLCLFRVLQEALQNAVKHSGVKHFRVELHCTSHRIHLSVSDSGVGFNPTQNASRTGLGLISMRERMRLIDGEFLVQSEPDRGTMICACAPFRRNNVESGASAL